MLMRFRAGGRSLRLYISTVFMVVSKQHNYVIKYSYLIQIICMVLVIPI